MLVNPSNIFFNRSEINLSYALCSANIEIATYNYCIYIHTVNIYGVTLRYGHIAAMERTELIDNLFIPLCY